MGVLIYPSATQRDLAKSLFDNQFVLDIGNKKLVNVSRIERDGFGSRFTVTGLDIRTGLEVSEYIQVSN